MRDPTPLIFGIIAMLAFITIWQGVEMDNDAERWHDINRKLDQLLDDKEKNDRD